MVQKITSSFRIEEDIYFEAKKKALDNHTTISQVIADCLAGYVKEENQTKLDVE